MSSVPVASGELSRTISSLRSAAVPAFSVREPLRRRSTPVRMAAVGVAALATALAVAWGIREWVTRGDADPPADIPLSTVELPARSVSVLAFENRGGSEGSGILAEGIPETVLHQLGLVPGVTVIARSSSFAFSRTRFCFCGKFLPARLM